MVAAELFNRIEQCLCDFNVIDEVDPTEADVLHVPCLVGTMVDDGCHATYDTTILARQEEFCLAEAESKEIRTIDKAPRAGAEGLKIAFLHPKSTMGVLTELCMKGE